MEHALERHREAAMYAMPFSVAQQLVADRRASYEAVACRHRLRRLVSRGPADDSRRVPLLRRATITSARRVDAGVEAAPVCKVA